MLDSLRDHINEILPGLDWDDITKLNEQLGVEISAVLENPRPSASIDEETMVSVQKKLCYMLLR